MHTHQMTARGLHKGDSAMTKASSCREEHGQVWIHLWMVWMEQSLGRRGLELRSLLRDAGVYKARTYLRAPALRTL